MVFLLVEWTKTRGREVGLYGPFGDLGKTGDEQPQAVEAAKAMLTSEIAHKKASSISACIHATDCSGRKTIPVYLRWVKGEWR